MKPFNDGSDKDEYKDSDLNEKIDLTKITQLHAYVSNNLKKRLKKDAEERTRSISYVVYMILNEHYTREDKDKEDNVKVIRIKDFKYNPNDPVVTNEESIKKYKRIATNAKKDPETWNKFNLILEWIENHPEILKIKLEKKNQNEGFDDFMKGGL